MDKVNETFWVRNSKKLEHDQKEIEIHWDKIQSNFVYYKNAEKKELSPSNKNKNSSNNKLEKII